jgi:hypothetical protein
MLFYLPILESLIGSGLSRLANYEKLTIPITVEGGGCVLDEFKTTDQPRPFLGWSLKSLEIGFC